MSHDNYQVIPYSCLVPKPLSSSNWLKYTQIVYFDFRRVILSYQFGMGELQHLGIDCQRDSDLHDCCGPFGKDP